MKRRAWGAGLAGLGMLAALAMPGCDGGHDPADTVFQHGVVVTVNSTDAVQQAVAVRDGRIVYVGTDAGVAHWIGPKTQVVELGGRMLMPGLVDGHLHALAGGRALLVCNLNYAPLARAELQSAIQACLDNSGDKEPDGWLEVVNWDRQSTAALSGDPDKSVLDALSTRRPIAVRSTDFHTLWVNSRALALAGVTAATADPTGGRFARDAQGNPTGICEDQASWQVAAFIPPDTEDDLLAQGRAALAALRAQGVTTFLDAAAGETQGRIFTALQKAGELTARTLLTVNLSPDEAAANPQATIAAAKTLASTYDQATVQAAPGVHIHTVKVFMDGVVNAPADTGALLSPYFSNTGTDAAPVWVQVPGGNAGSVYYPSTVMQPLMLAAAQAGLDMHLHATGERAVREALDAVAFVRKQAPRADFRPVIAHDETVAVADYPRFKALDVSPVMSFQWAQQAPYSVGDTQHHLGPDRFARMEPFGSLANAGARVAYGSDWPIDPFDEFLALKVGVTRSGDPTNPHSFGPDFAGKINADPALTRAAALRAITANAAYTLRMDKSVGSIEVGKFADLIVLDQNFLTQPEDELARNTVLLTVSGGKVVHGLAPFDGLVTAAAAPRSRALNLGAATGRVVHPGTGPDGHNH
jgi:predicted amidohydrolase YtcJ